MSREARIVSCFLRFRFKNRDRFFVATELKTMLAHILINYDVKAETEGVRPADEWFGLAGVSNRHGKIFIRKRE
jgi:hypothetical protein